MTASLTEKFIRTKDFSNRTNLVHVSLFCCSGCMLKGLGLEGLDLRPWPRRSRPTALALKV